MNVALWAEIRRLSEMEKLSQRGIAQRLRCSRRTVKRALAMDRSPATAARLARGSLLDPYRPQIDALLAKYPKLSAVRILEELRRGPEGYRGGISLIRRYVRQVRPAGGRVYQEVVYQPGEAFQVDWGDCGRIQVGNTLRRVYVLVAVLCYSPPIPDLRCGLRGDPPVAGTPSPRTTAPDSLATPTSGTDRRHRTGRP